MPLLWEGALNAVILIVHDLLRAFLSAIRAGMLADAIDQRSHS
ncbi:MAG: hypothetical protein V7L21_23615 [Nostoc sp.]